MVSDNWAIAVLLIGSSSIHRQNHLRISQFFLVSPSLANEDQRQVDKVPSEFRARILTNFATGSLNLDQFLLMLRRMRDERRPVSHSPKYPPFSSILHFVTNHRAWNTCNIKLLIQYGISREFRSIRNDYISNLYLVSVQHYLKMTGCSGQSLLLNGHVSLLAVRFGLELPAAAWWA